MGVSVINWSFFLSSSAFALQSGDFTYTESAGTITITKYIGSGGNVIIPSAIDGMPVVNIGQDAFNHCASLTSIFIPEGVTSIGWGAFAYCTGLTNVSIPDSVTNIEGSVFGDCTALTSISIPNNVISIGQGMFYNCSSLVSVTIPNRVTSIGNGAFHHCIGLTSVDIPNSVTSIGNSAFYNCSGLTSVTIPNGVTSIGNDVLAFCGGLTSVTIGKSVTSIGDRAFWDCTSLTSVTIPDSVTSIGYQSFVGCSSLTSVTIPDRVTSIGNGAFWGCSSLTSVTIPDSITTIGWAMFRGCRGLTSVTIPDSVTSIGNEAFAFCSGLTSVTIGNSITSIGDGAFYGCSNLTSLYFYGNAPSMGGNVFYGCPSNFSICYTARSTGFTTPTWCPADCYPAAACATSVLEVGTGKPYTTIQSAIAAANTGDTVLVYDGTYNEQINFKGKAIAVKSVNGALSTTIDGTGLSEFYGLVVLFTTNEDSNSLLEGFTITRGSGSGIVCNGSSPTITNCTISGNGWAGVESASSTNSFSSTISNYILCGNTGGGVRCVGSPTPTITIWSMSGKGLEGVLSGSGEDSSPTIINCIFSGNGSAGVGCGIGSLNPTITNCTISGNTRDGVRCYACPTPTITNCTISGNTGDGVLSSQSSPTITNSTISSNTGFGVNGVESRVTFTNCTISGNVKAAVWCSETQSTITNCTISGNTGGGVISFDSTTITNCTISGNTATNGGGIYVGTGGWGPSRATIANCTISGNTATNGGGIYCAWASSFTVENSILWENFATTSGNDIYLGGSNFVTVTYSNVKGGYAGTGNIDSDPLFVNFAGGDYHLTSGSPCIDAGTCNNAPSTDIKGTSRPQGAGCDMGAYEFQPSPTPTTTTAPTTTTTSPYTPPDNRPYVTFIDENGCPIQYDQGGGFQFENINANTVPSNLYYKGIVHITPGYCYNSTCFTCYDLKIENKYNTGLSDLKTWANVTDVQIVYFTVDTTKMDKTVAERTNLADVGVTFYQCGESAFAQPPQGLNLNQDSNGCPPVTLISLSSLTATPKNNAVTLEWKTESEIDNAGFNLYRAESENGQYTKINASLIPAKGSSTQGASYEFTDTNVQNRKTYYYKLEDIDLSGKSTMHGSVIAMPRLIYGIVK
jgi:parallel beta-helix repeat protein